MVNLSLTTSRVGRLSAAIGALVWLVLFAFAIGDSRETELIQRIVLLGVLVVVPLALSLVPGEQERMNGSRLYRMALLMQPFGAVAATISFFVEPGPAAATLACFWFCVTATIAFVGLQRLADPGLRSVPELSIAGGLMYLPIGGFWLVVSRFGVQLMGFGDTIILLTAVHFTFAAYAAPILAGLTGRRLQEHRPIPRLFAIVPFGIIAGTPLVAAGITFSPLTALVGTVMIAIALFALATIVIVSLLRYVAPLSARLLLIVASFSSGMAVILACIYAYSIVARKLLIDIPQMAMTHGLINAFGFVLCGLLAWTIIHSPSQPS